MSTKKTDYFYGLDLVRFLSAFWVAFFHLGYTTWASPRSAGRVIAQGSYATPEFAPFAWFGLFGVELFFIISGFVVANSAVGRTPIAFLKSRALRLYPAAWVCASATALFKLSEGMPIARKFFNSIVLWPKGPFVDGQYWTIGLEILFYACIFFMLAIGQLKRIFQFSTALVCWSGIFLVALQFFPGLIFMTKGGWLLILLYHGVYFSLGMFLYAYASGRWKVWMLPVVTVTMVIVYFQIARRSKLILSEATPELYAQWPIGLLVFTLGAAAIIFSIRYHEYFYRLPGGLLRLCRNLGLATYPLYLLHFALGVGLIRELVRAGVPQLAAVPLVIVVMTIAALTIALLIEPWIRKGLRIVIDTIDRKLLARFGVMKTLYRTDNSKLTTDNI